MLRSVPRLVTLSRRSGGVLTRPRRFQTRTFRLSPPSKESGGDIILKSDYSVRAIKYFHMSSGLLLLAFPVALVLSPSKINVPVDLGLSVVLPLHAHVGIMGIISDYVPPAMRTAARMGWTGVTIASILGLMRLSLGAGLTEVCGWLSFEPLYSVERG